MTGILSTEATRRRRAARPGSAVHRYFFYGWMFRDAQRGSPLERAAALRHNREQARWLPTYLRRWLVVGMLLAAAEAGSERAFDAPVVAATFAVALVGVVVLVVVTAICWAGLRLGPPP